MPEDEGPSATNRLAEFLATCVTYPALYIFATSAASPEELAKGQVRAAPGKEMHEPIKTSGTSFR